MASVEDMSVALAALNDQWTAVYDDVVDRYEGLLRQAHFWWAVALVTNVVLTVMLLVVTL